MRFPRLLEFIDARLAAVEKTERAASIEAGDADVIRNIRRDHAPRLSTLRRLAAPLRCPAEDLIRLMAEDEGETVLSDVPIESDDVAIVGIVKAGSWQEHGAWDVNRYENIKLSADPRYPVDRQFGVAVYGTSINKIAHDGQFLLCLGIRFAEGEETPVKDGDLAVIERHSTDGSVEATVKRLRRGSDGWELRYESNDPRWRGFIRASETLKRDEEGHEVRLTGKVLTIGIPKQG